MASQGGDDDNFPTPGGSYFTPNNGISAVIAALEDEIGLEGFDQVQWRVFFKDRHTRDKRQLRQNGGALIFALYRA